MTDSEAWDRIAESLSVRRADFYPVGSLTDKRNYKRFFRIQPDGTIRETVRLNVVDPSHREQLICRHYLRHLVRHFLRESVGVNVLGRDSPWDFRLRLSTGEEFFLEITSIGDNEYHFELNKREERFTRWAGEELIPLHELKKLAVLFPGAKLTKELERKGRGNSELVPNPLKAAEQRIFVSSTYESAETLEQKIRLAIEKKANKPHRCKEATVVIIDNRTSAFDFQEYRSAARGLEPIFNAVPFPEIWLYTGYCSDDDGNNAEFSFAPLKITPAQAEVLGTLPTDSKGRHVW